MKPIEDSTFESMTGWRAARVANYKTIVREYYRLVMAAYRRFWGDSYHFALFDEDVTREEALAATERLIAQQGRFAPGMQVLDVGCGLGGPALTIAQYSGADVTGIDLCEAHAHTARERAESRGLTSHTWFLAADGMHLPFCDGTFDRVYTFEAGCHMPDKERFYQECARVLRPGGEFLGLDWLRGDGLSAWEEESLVEPICRYNCVPDLINLFELRDLLRQVGLEVLAVEDAGARAGILRNWEPVRNGSPTIDDVVATDELWGLQRISEGGLALVRAAFAGAFIVGRWHARKPLETAGEGAVR